MNILWFLIGMAVIGAVWAVADAIYSRRREALVDEGLFARYVRALARTLGAGSAPVAITARLRRGARPHWNMLRQAEQGELPRQLRGVNRAIVEHLPSSARAQWLLRSSPEQEALAERAYREAAAMVDDAD